MSNIAGVLQEAGTACPLRAPGFIPDFLVVVHVARVFSFLCCVFTLFVFVLCLVSCVPNLASFSGLSILDCVFDFL